VGGELAWQTVTAFQPSPLVHLLWQGLSTTPMAQVPGALHRMPVRGAHRQVTLTIPVPHPGWIVWLLSVPSGVQVMQVHWAPMSTKAP
jgi:hypothetical protein